MQDRLRMLLGVSSIPREQVWEAGGYLRSWIQVGFMGIVAIFVGNSRFKEQTGPWELEQGHGAVEDLWFRHRMRFSKTESRFSAPLCSG